MTPSKDPSPANPSRSDDESDAPTRHSGGASVPRQARFLTGSTMRHVVEMSATGAIGLMAIFLVDLADIYFLSLLGEVEVAAAVGYAGSLLFFTTSIGIGLSIATSALVARAIGAGDEARARRLATHAVAFAVCISAVLALLIWIATPQLLTLLGATGRAHELALSYLRIIIPSMPLLAVGMAASGILRALADPRRAMLITLAGGLTNAIFDPLLIFGAGLGVDGAALASVLSRVAVVAVGLHYVVRDHGMIGRLQLDRLGADVRPVLTIALPAILTNIATPVGNAYITATVAQFGDDAVAGWAVIGRIIPVTFGVLFALSGSIGPIIGQNRGARQFDRVRSAFRDALYFTGGCVAVAWLLLAGLSDAISDVFGLQGDGRSIVEAYCYYVVPLFFFLGALFVANAIFNNLDRPHFSTVLNWGRATIGTMPFTTAGAAWLGAPGAIAGGFAGTVVFGLIATWLCARVINHLAEEDRAERNGDPPPRLIPSFPQWPFSSRTGQ